MLLRLDRLADVVVILAALTVTVLTVVRFTGKPEPTAVMPKYAIGESIGQVPGLVLSEKTNTLLLVVRSTCRYCTASMDFYRRLRAIQESGQQFEVAAVGVEPKETITEYLTSHGLRLDIVAVVGSEFKPLPTPTLLLVDGSGKVLGTWAGQLGPVQEQEVLRALRD